MDTKEFIVQGNTTVNVPQRYHILHKGVKVLKHQQMNACI